ncbi:MAG: polysaccharide deacetylase family protein [Gammaproteobacteria bacterium]|nr:polysaccharide deacetylase family protein [Gammaproteobacteria bacterium]MCW9058140.1 polysaccharide deacetylase family protein [Gammaproteobacteria bacterium]
MIDPLTSLLHRQAGRHGPVMLMYHSVQPGAAKPDWPWAISMRRFREQLDLLAAGGWTTTTMAELAAKPDRWPERTLVITFDDGYADNLAACEELHSRGMRATWFIVSGSIGRAPGWEADRRPHGRMLDAGELREMHAAGMEIGSHGVGHVRLTEVSDDRLLEELALSKTTLEALLGEGIDSFAYPYGAWDARCESAVRRAGYRYACTTRTGLALKDAHPLRMRRLAVFNHDDAGSLARKLSLTTNDGGWNNVFHYLRARAVARVSGNMTKK